MSKLENCFLVKVDDRIFLTGETVFNVLSFWIYPFSWYFNYGNVISSFDDLSETEFVASFIFYIKDGVLNWNLMFYVFLFSLFLTFVV